MIFFHIIHIIKLVIFSIFYYYQNHSKWQQIPFEKIFHSRKICPESIWWEFIKEKKKENALSSKGRRQKKNLYFWVVGTIGGGGGSRPDHNFRPKKYKFFFLLSFDSEHFKTCKYTKKKIFGYTTPSPMWTGAVNPSKVTEYTPAGLHNNTLVNAFICVSSNSQNT